MNNIGLAVTIITLLTFAQAAYDIQVEVKNDSLRSVPCNIGCTIICGVVKKPYKECVKECQKHCHRRPINNIYNCIFSCDATKSIDVNNDEHDRLQTYDVDPCWQRCQKKYRKDIEENSCVVWTLSYDHSKIGALNVHVMPFTN
ncbi:hypothetical protein Fmac_020163 [Flemingia macrophylla]|uniref:Uncharacterized protein n=1 Tax=Flemingia macrophylla TaxID=520843 RepID=A0ABD1LTE3_9FABA